MSWIEHHRKRWTAKPGLRRYYETEIFQRVVSRLPGGPCLEIGAGPGFFSSYAKSVVSTDVEFHARLSVCADAQRLPFRSGSFDSVVGIDVLHHLAAPAIALAEAVRVLRLGGSLILVEPWAGPVASVFYRYIHHEDCRPVADPFDLAYPERKNPMRGNAWIPKAILVDRESEMKRRVSGLQLRTTETFGSASFLSTGGFYRFGLPWGAISSLLHVERLLPAAALAFVALRAMFVLERVEGDSGNCNGENTRRV